MDHNVPFGLRSVAVGDAWLDNSNHIVVYRNTVAEEPAVAGHRRLSGDGGYRGVPEIHGPDGKIVDGAAWKRFRRSGPSPNT
ncbi:hypothetical protein [Nonomuraea sp. NPDC049480]|uniref:hypothetical protein n=1 Tax=Nonomuraea sp. NPDC049480 TaxID=3364353 RepID=UPI00379EE014